MNDYLNQHMIPSAPQNQEEPPRRKAGSRGFAATLAVCLLCSSAMGFTGGYLASSLRGSEQAAAPESSTVSASSSVPEAMTVSQVAGSVSDTVVEITTQVQTANFFRQPVAAQGAGSGVILSEDGYIVTNHHVIEDAQSITVRLKNGESYAAELIGSDAKTDIAVIKIDASGLNAAPIGDSGSLQAGDDAIAIGNPLGELGGTVTNGIISAVSREVDIDGQTMTLLQTNAAINPGNSGGGLFNNRGELIGIVVAKSAGNGVEGLGFAIPIDTVKTVAADLVANGYVTGRGELGVSVVEINDQQAAFYYRVPQTGVYVAGIKEGSAAQAAGIQVGDGIAAVGGEPVASSQDLKTLLEQYGAGDSVALTILRGSETLTLTATLTESIPDTAPRQEV